MRYIAVFALGLASLSVWGQTFEIEGGNPTIHPEPEVTDDGWDWDHCALPTLSSAETAEGKRERYSFTNRQGHKICFIPALTCDRVYRDGSTVEKKKKIVNQMCQITSGSECPSATECANQERQKGVKIRLADYVASLEDLRTNTQVFGPIKVNGTLNSGSQGTDSSAGSLNGGSR